MSTLSGPHHAAAPPAAPPRFVTGSIMRHLLVMMGTGAVGLMAIFVGDLANMYFLSLLKDVEIVAAVGYASSILFLATSIGIGLAIAASSLVAPALGAGDRTRARRLSTNTHIAAAGVSALLALVLWLLVPYLLTGLGATGRTHALAVAYLSILVPALPPLALGMASGSVLRSVGDAPRAMHITLAGAIVNIILDPIFIFALGLGIEGAALASVGARLAIMAIGLYGVVRIHDLMARPDLATLIADTRAITAIAMPAVAANIATPVSNAYVTYAIAPYGDDAVAGWAIIGRIMPVAFGAIYALSGSIAPVLGQNLGARDFGRVRSTLVDALKITAGFTALAWLLLALFGPMLAGLFNATRPAADLILFNCRWVAPLFVFLGALFVANACFNTLGKAYYSTLFNWGRATLGTLPFVSLGGWLAGPKGVLMGSMVGGVAFGIAAVWLCRHLIDKIETESARITTATAAPELRSNSANVKH
jgi:putative MATE family efflux protein